MKSISVKEDSGINKERFSEAQYSLLLMMDHIIEVCKNKYGGYIEQLRNRKLLYVLSVYINALSCDNKRVRRKYTKMIAAHLKGMRVTGRRQFGKRTLDQKTKLHLLMIKYMRPVYDFLMRSRIKLKNNKSKEA